MRTVANSPDELVLEHRPIVLPVLCAALVVTVLVQTIKAADSLDVGEWIGSGFGILVGAFIAYLTALRSRVVFDGRRREVRWQHLGWPGRGQNRCRFDDLAGVQVQTDRPDGGAARVTLLTSGGSIPLTRHFQGLERHHQTAATVRAWLSQHGCDLPADK